MQGGGLPESQLEQTVTTRNATTQPSTSTIPPYSFTLIQKCPTEILLEIFQHYLELDTRVIRRLLLVCKRWHDIVISAPTLWINLSLRIDTRHADAKDVVDSVTPRIAAVLRYSRNLPLHVTIHARNVLSVDEIMERRRENTQILTEGASLIVSDDEAMMNDTDAPWHPHRVILLLRYLTGEKGEHMERWKRFSIFLSSDMHEDLLFPILEQFKWPTPQLLSLKIQDVSDDPQRVGIEAPIFPVIPLLRYLKVQYTGFFERLQVSHSTIYNICIPSPWQTPSAMAALNSCQSLFGLEIWSTEQDQQGELSNLAISLPLLKGISFIGYSGPPRDATYELPVLNEVRIERRSPTEFTYLPNLSPRKVRWFIRDGWQEDWSGEEIQGAIRQILESYHRIRTLVVSESTAYHAEAVLDQMDDEDELPAKFKRIQVVSDEDSRTITRIITVIDY